MIKIPGMTDPHVHLRSMDWSHKGTFASETAAALAGGYTLVLDMPNTPPSTTSRPALDRKLAEIGAQAVCDWGVYFGASQSDNTGQFAGVSREICGLKIYCNATTGDLLVEDQALRRRIYQSWPLDRMIAVHAEGATVPQILGLVRQTRKRTHFCHISTADEIASLTRAKNDGLPVSVGVTPHHLYLTQDDLPTLGPLGLMKPELKTPADQKALWEALESGIVDVVESDHAPHTLAEKRSEKPPFGVPGLEATLSLLLLAVQEGRLTLERAVDLVASAPRRVFGIANPPETYTLVDLDQSWLVEDASLRTAARWSPFAGMRLPGRVVEVRLRGTKVFDGQDVLVADGFGTNRFGRS